MWHAIAVAMSEFETRIDADTLEARIESVRSVALHRHLGLRVEEYGRGASRLVLPATPKALNNVGTLHGGILYAVLDTACYCAGAGMWAANENAVTLDIHVQVLRPGGTHDVELRGWVLKRGRTTLFGKSEAWSDGKLVAAAAVTKSIVALPR
jgi:uncharacterized protein (TIGR00369 family)